MILFISWQSIHIYIYGLWFEAKMRAWKIPAANDSLHITHRSCRICRSHHDPPIYKAVYAYEYIYSIAISVAHILRLVRPINERGYNNNFCCCLSFYIMPFYLYGSSIIYDYLLWLWWWSRCGRVLPACQPWPAPLPPTAPLFIQLIIFHKFQWLIKYDFYHRLA